LADWESKKGTEAKEPFGSQKIEGITFGQLSAENEPGVLSPELKFNKDQPHYSL